MKILSSESTFSFSSCNFYLSSYALVGAYKVTKLLFLHFLQLFMMKTFLVVVKIKIKPTVFCENIFF